MSHRFIILILFLLGFSASMAQPARELPTIEGFVGRPARHKESPVRGVNGKKAFGGLFIEHSVEREFYPFSLSIFFLRGSASLPARYELSSSRPDGASFNDSTIPGGTLQKYYRVLDIIGSRLERSPEAAITITGCNSGESRVGEKRELSQQRAEAVRDYLAKVWSISSSRMTLRARDLPEVLSASDTPLGEEENRRVEITSNSYEIVAPVMNAGHRYGISDDVLAFTIHNGIADSLVADRWIEIRRNGDLWYRMENLGIIDTATPGYNWGKDGDEDAIPIEPHAVPYSAQLIVKDLDGREYRSDAISIPVKSVEVEAVRFRCFGPDDSTIDRFALSLFGFNSATLSRFDQRVLQEYIYPSITQRADVLITGHADLVGGERRNLQLSEQRAKAVERLVRRDCSYSSLLALGVGEDDPLYPNNLPEGRFYNRTVQVRISTPR